jgi:hypothetical protein
MKKAKCKFCGCTHVAWVQSKRGKWYLTNIYVVNGEETFRIGRLGVPVPHKCLRKDGGLKYNNKVDHSPVDEVNYSDTAVRKQKSINTQLKKIQNENKDIKKRL